MSILIKINNKELTKITKIWETQLLRRKQNQSYQKN